MASATNKLTTQCTSCWRDTNGLMRSRCASSIRRNKHKMGYCMAFSSEKIGEAYQTEIDTYFPVFKHENQLFIDPRRFCEASNQVVQVRINELGKVVSCVDAKLGCPFYTGKMKPQNGEHCLLGENRK